MGTLNVIAGWCYAAVVRRGRWYGSRRRTVPLAQRVMGRELAALLHEGIGSAGLAALSQLPSERFAFAAWNPSEAVRRKAARALAPSHLASMANDPSPAVRAVIAERLPADQLFLLAGDMDPFVRFIVAERVPAEELAAFLDDADESVRELASLRLTKLSQRYVSQILGDARPAAPVHLKELA